MAAVGTWGVFSLRYWGRQRRDAALARKVRASLGGWKIEEILTRTLEC